VKILLSTIAKADLKEIVDYIKRDSVRYAILEKERIKTTIDSLYNQPISGRVFQKFNNENIRELIHRHYSIIYKINTDQTQIEIPTIHHHARLLGNNAAFKTSED